MAIQLTPEQEQRIIAIVDRGAYSSAQEALEAAVAAVEVAAGPDFDDANELASLLSKGFESAEMSEEEFWDSVDRETGALLAAYKPHRRA